MALVRMLVSWKRSPADPDRESFENTLYFNVSGGVGQDPDYQALVNDLLDVWAGTTWANRGYIRIRAYDMADAKPRPVKAQGDRSLGAYVIDGVPQVALCLSYYADRNLPRSRGRIYLGPWNTSRERPTTDQMNAALNLTTGLAGLGGLNVDWSLYSPTTGNSTRINHAWVDNSWDIIRARKLPGTARVQKTLNG